MLPIHLTRKISYSPLGNWEMQMEISSKEDMVTLDSLMEYFKQDLILKRLENWLHCLSPFVDFFKIWKEFLLIVLKNLESIELLLKDRGNEIEA